MAGAERLHRRFLRGKPRGERRRRVAPTPAVRDFPLSEHAVNEPVAIALDGLSDAADLGRVDPGSYNFHLRRSYMTLPTVPESFYWTDTPEGRVLKCRPLEVIAPHLFTTRELQLTSRDDWRQVAALLDADDTVTLNQVHGRSVVVVRAGAPPAPERQDADALVSNDPGVAIAVRAADCVPLLFADSTTGAVAAVHAGWRGTAAGAAVAALEALGREFGSRPDDITVAIGPSIGRVLLRSGFGAGRRICRGWTCAASGRSLVLGR